MLAAHRIALRLLLLGALVASLVVAGTAGVASAAPAPVTICPALGTVAVATPSGGSSCVNNDCVSIALAATGGAAACDSATVRSQTIMDVAPTAAPLVTAPRTISHAAPLAPALPLSTTALVIRSMIAIGVAALLLAGALLLGGRRTRRRAEGEPTRTTTPA